MSEDTSALHPAGEGRGRLLQRDYWAVLKAPELSPRGIARTVFEHFERFAPPDIVRFHRSEESAGALGPGDELEVEIPLAGSFGVRVVHRSALSITLVTLEGHPEAGRITFGVYPNAGGETVFHIRSRARSGSPRFALGFPAAGEPMQTNAWAGYIDRVAAVVAHGVRGVIHVETKRVEETDADRSAEELEPTFRAVDDRPAEPRA